MEARIATQNLSDSCKIEETPRNDKNLETLINPTVQKSEEKFDSSQTVITEDSKSCENSRDGVLDMLTGNRSISSVKNLSLSKRIRDFQDRVKVTRESIEVKFKIDFEIFFFFFSNRIDCNLFRKINFRIVQHFQRFVNRLALNKN